MRLLVAALSSWTLGATARSDVTHAAATPTGSPMELITRLQHEHDNLQPVHPQSRSWRRHVRRLIESGAVVMDRSNTDPIRIKVDNRSLISAHAEPFTSCFNEGDWFRRGFPDPYQANPTTETCQRGAGESLGVDGCWGRCKDYDLITDADAAKMTEVVVALAAEVSNLLAVFQEETLRFTVSQGTYARALQSKGYPSSSSCAADCRVLSGVSVDPAYCQNPSPGDGYDVILSLTKPPGVSGVAGTGSSCAADQAGRPLWAVLAWHSSIVGMRNEDTATLVNRHRGFVLHEILHGLGFVNSQFNYARDSQGQRKGLIELRPTKDAAGNVVDEVWFFVKGRAYELAQLYFDCYSNSTGAWDDREWDGLPLMGLPEAGRAAHWETRIMRDDVMSYGFQPHVSSITLAAMEDLGFYLANYSAAGCMLWGFRQGCRYVRTRCEVALSGPERTARLASVLNDGNGRDLCSGDPFWGTPDSYLQSSCWGGLDPCDTPSQAGFELQTSCPPPDSHLVCSRCDAQCAREPVGGRNDCAAAPSSDPEAHTGSVLDDLRSRLNSIDWQAWLIPLIYVMILLIVVSIVRRCVCPVGPTCRKIAFGLLVVIGMIAAAFVAGSYWLFTKRDMYKAYVGFNTIVVSGSIGVVLLIFVVVEGYALCTRKMFTLRLGFYGLLVLCVIEVLTSLLVCYWVYSLGAIPTDTLNSLFGDSREQIDSALADVLERPVSVAEGLVCKTYQACCRDPNLDFMIIHDPVEPSSGSSEYASGEHASGGSFVPPVTNMSQATCLEPGLHSSFNNLDAALRDPSNENFCAYTSGAPARLLTTPPSGVCDIIERLADYSLQDCRDNFCTSGTDGYLSFVTMFVELLQRYAWPLGIGLAVLVVLQLILAFNLRQAAVLIRQKMQAQQIKKDYELRFRTPTYVENV